MITEANYISDEKLLQTMGSIRVAEIDIKGRPDTDRYIAFPRIVETEELELYQNIIVEPHAFRTDNTASETIHLVDKLKPHSLYDLTLFYGGNNLKKGYQELNHDTQENLIRISKTFCEYGENQGLKPSIAFSYDPITTDRKSGQSIKRFHLHLIARTPEELADVEKNAIGYEESLQTYGRNVFIDEWSLIIARILEKDLANKAADVGLCSVPKVLPESPSYLSFSLGEDWMCINTASLANTINNFSNYLITVSNYVVQESFKGNMGFWDRPTPLNYIKLPPDMSIDEFESNLLQHAFSKLDPRKARQIERTNQRLNQSTINEAYPLAGLASCVSITREIISGQIYLNFRPQVFLATGGAGLTNINGVEVKLNRGTGVFTEDEVASRKLFQQNFASLV